MVVLIGRNPIGLRLVKSGATAEFPPEGLKSCVCKYIKLGAWSIPNKPHILADE